MSRTVVPLLAIVAVLLAANLVRMGGSPAESLTNVGIEGACCTPSGECIRTREPLCTALGGTFTAGIDNCLSVDCGSCPEDVTGNGTVDFADLVSILSAWGPCEP